MEDSEDDAIQRVKVASRERAGKELTDSEASDLIEEYFDPSPPPPQLTQAQVDAIVQTLANPPQDEAEDE
jgi:hypothetical protein